VRNSDRRKFPSGRPVFYAVREAEISDHQQKSGRRQCARIEVTVKAGPGLYNTISLPSVTGAGRAGLVRRAKQEIRKSGLMGEAWVLLMTAEAHSSTDLAWFPSIHAAVRLKPGAGRLLDDLQKHAEDA